MRRTGIALLLVAALLAVARLCTGVVYRADEPVSALVLRPPALAVTRTETAARPLDDAIILDEDEPRLVYEPLYLAAMQAAPVLVVLMGLAGLLLLRRRPRPA